LAIKTKSRDKSIEDHESKIKNSRPGKDNIRRKYEE
jgi:hypothetical protein